jgi:hypothetical protein
MEPDEIRRDVELVLAALEDAAQECHRLLLGTSQDRETAVRQMLGFDLTTYEPEPQEVAQYEAYQRLKRWGSDEADV